MMRVFKFKAELELCTDSNNVVQILHKVKNRGSTFYGGSICKRDCLACIQITQLCTLLSVFCFFCFEIVSCMSMQYCVNSDAKHSFEMFCRKHFHIGKFNG